MFTGIVTDLGEVMAFERDSDGARLSIKVDFDLESVAIGASIAHNGCCLSVTDKTQDRYSVYASNETLNLTTLAGWQVGQFVNLERALKLGDELGGHLVLGHVDGQGEVVGRDVDGDSLRLQFKVPKPLHRYISTKGSVAIDGVSLTVNAVEDQVFGVNLIPITQTETTLGTLQSGQFVTIEIDPLARYAARWEETR